MGRIPAAGDGLMVLLNPPALIGLSLLLPVWLLAIRYRGLPRWRGVSLLRSLAIAAVVLALARPAMRLRSDRLTHVVAIDTSLSARGTAVNAGSATVAAIARHLRKQDTLHVMTVDGQANLVATMRGGSEAQPNVQELTSRTSRSANQSRLALGLLSASALVDARGSGRVTLISDGRETDEGLQLAARQLAHAGVVVDTIPTPNPAPLALTRFSVPGHFSAGEKITLSATLECAQSASGTATLLRDGKVVATQPVAAQRGENTVAFETIIRESAPARHEIRFQRTGANASEFSIAATLAPTSRVRVLLIEVEARRGVALRDALAREGIEVVLQLPAAKLGNLNEYSAVLLGDVLAAELGRANQVALRDYVKQHGGGLVMLGGERSYGPGGYDKTPVAEVLPVEFEQERQEQDPSVALVLIIDTSGSMTGSRLQLAKEIGVRAARHLTPQDRVGVIEFYGSRRWAVPLQRASDLASIELVIERLRAAGGTVLYPALEEAYYGLVNVRARYKHVLILSDGDVFPGPFNALAARMASEGMTVSTVKVAPEGSSVFLQDIGFHGRGRSFDYSGITVPDIDVKQMSRVPQSPFREAPFAPTVVKKDMEILKGVDLAQAPPLLGYVTVRPHARAEEILRTPSGELLLARWQYGLGRTIAFTSDARDRWANAWLKWEGFGKFWSQVIRDVARDDTLTLRMTRTALRDREVVRVEPRNGVTEIQAETVGAPPIFTRVIKEGESYVVSLPAGESEARTLRFTAKANDGVTRATAMLIPSRPQQELRALQPDATLLRAVSEQTGGVYQPSPAQLTRRGVSKRVLLEVGHWLLGFSALTLLTEVLVRRLP